MRGIRLNFVVEGQTEEAFVKKVLAPHLGNLSIWANARSVQTSRKRNIKHRGGIVRYAQAHHDIARWMREQSGPDVRFTTMFDLFRLPRDFPSNEAPTPVDPRERVDALQQALLEDIDDDRLLPYIQLHEFESLVLVDPGLLQGLYPEHASGVDRLVAMAAAFASPEQIEAAKRPRHRRGSRRKSPPTRRQSLGPSSPPRLACRTFARSARISAPGSTGSKASHHP